jgi:hypothetical protein
LPVSTKLISLEVAPSITNTPSAIMSATVGAAVGRDADVLRHLSVDSFW